MKSKISQASIKFSEKNRIYLERLGFIDGRTGKVRREGPVLNKFLNECITRICEEFKSGYTKQLSNNDELRKAWIKHKISRNNKSIEKLQKENVELAKQITLERANDDIKEVLEKLSKEVI